MMRVFFVMLFFVSAGFCQLMPKRVQSDSLTVEGQTKPLVYVDSSGQDKNSALTGLTASMDSREFSNDSTIGTVIGVGAEFVGDVMKGMLSPNSPEADAVELERTRR